MPICTKCHTPVYHVEQTFGPGRKIYHKPCLKCEGCGKRLEAGALVEHELLPYCKHCHLKLFGTKDLRHFNHPQAQPPISPSNSISSVDPTTPSMPSYQSARTSSSITSPSLPPPPPISYLTSPKPRPPPPSPSTKPVLNGSSSIPQSSQPAHGPPSPFLSSASLAVSSSPRTRSSPSFFSPKPSTTPKCPACDRSVFFAEQAIALDRPWHKACLRCSVCGKGLSQGGVQEHDGQPCCGTCYKKHFGPLGGGYALR